MKFKKWIAAVFSAVTMLAGGQAAAVPVGLELLLLVDVSGSVDAGEYALQKTGYVNAFNSAAVQNAILNSQGGAIAVSYVEWSGPGQTSQLVGWTLINSVASAQAFAAAIGITARAFNGNTAVQDAIGNTFGLFGTETGGGGNGFESLRQVVDVSGDGAHNTGSVFCNVVVNPACGRDAALAAGVDTVNGLAILGEAGLLAYYTNNVAGGVNGFAVAAANFNAFEAAIQAKLIREVNGVPEPASVALVGLALVIAGAMRRRTMKR